MEAGQRGLFCPKPEGSLHCPPLQIGLDPMIVLRYVDWIRYVEEEKKRYVEEEKNDMWKKKKNDTWSQNTLSLCHLRSHAPVLIQVALNC